MSSGWAYALLGGIGGYGEGLAEQRKRESEEAKQMNLARFQQQMNKENALFADELATKRQDAEWARADKVKGEDRAYTESQKNDERKLIGVDENQNPYYGSPDGKIWDHLGRQVTEPPKVFSQGSFGEYQKGKAYERFGSTGVTLEKDPETGEMVTVPKGKTKGIDKKVNWNDDGSASVYDPNTNRVNRIQSDEAKIEEQAGLDAAAWAEKSSEGILNFRPSEEQIELFKRNRIRELTAQLQGSGNVQGGAAQKASTVPEYLKDPNQKDFPGYPGQGRMYDYEALFNAQKQVESGNRDFGKDGQPITSSKGAKYAAQVMDKTAGDPGFGIKPAGLQGTPEQIAEEYNRVGREYSQKMLERYNGNVEHALAAYNWGPGNVDKWLAAGADPAKMPQETRNYIASVVKRVDTGQPGKPAEILPAQQGQRATTPEDQRRQKILENAAAKRQAAQGQTGQPQQMQQPSGFPVIGADYVPAGQAPNDQSAAQQLGVGAGALVSGVKSGTQSIGNAATAMVNAGGDISRVQWWADQVRVLGAAGKASLAAIMENERLAAEDVARMAMERNWSLDQFIEGFKKGYK